MDDIVMEGTGSIMLWRSLQQFEAVFPGMPGVTILPKDLLYPLTSPSGRSVPATGDLVFLDQKGAYPQHWRFWIMFFSCGFAFRV
jgi:hypothetical protein